MKKLLFFVLALVMLAGLIPHVTLMASAAEKSAEFDIENLRFDDHVDISGKTVEIVDDGTPTSYQVGYGVEENAVLDTAVVTLEDNTLVATGIGSATVKVDGKIHEITVTAAPISLLLLIGQSNMRGSEGNANQSIVCPDGMVYSTYGDDRGESNTAMTVSNASHFAPSALTGTYSSINVAGTTDCLSGYPVNSLTEAGAGKIGPDSGFAYEWVKQTGEKVWIVNAAHGGTSINVWQPGTTEYEQCQALFTACQETLQKEIAAGHFTLSHMGYFWCQGCSDRAQSAEWYVKKYLAMHESLKDELTFDHDSNPETVDKTFEFGGIIPVRVGNTAAGYRDGAYTVSNPYAYHESFVDLRMNGPRVAQYWMINNPELPDIWGVCNIGDDWVWMPDGTNGVATYFQTHYPNGTVDYTTQVAQKASWYTPTTPKAVHDSIHYNQIGYNEIGRESVRNALIMLGEIEAPEVETTVGLLSWNGYSEVSEVIGSTYGNSGTLVVPKIYPLWEAKNVDFELSEGLEYVYYDLIADSAEREGTLSANGKTVSIIKAEPGAHYKEHLSTLPENVCYGLNLWNILEHDKYYFASGTNWSIYSGGTVKSVTISVEPGEKIFATSWGKAGENGNASTNGIRVTFFSAYGVAKTMTTAECYAEFSKNGGYLVAPEDAVAINIAMWNNSDENEIYLLDREHDTDSGICGICGKDSHTHEWSGWKIKEIPGKGEPVTEERNCSGCGEAETRQVESVWHKYDLAAHYSDLPENVCYGLNLWNILEHDKYYFANGTNWSIYSGGTVKSVTISVEPGEKIFATSWGKAGENGHATADGIRVSFFDAYGVAKTMTPAECYSEFFKNGGYLIAPEGAIAVNVAMWNNSNENELYILNRDHRYENGICAGCGVKEPHIHFYKSAVTAPTCTEQGYTTYTCDCWDSYVDDYVDATGHIYENCICTGCGAVQPAPEWEVGTIAYVNGLDRDSTTRLRTADYLKLSDYAAVRIGNGYELVRFVYDENHTMLSGTDWLGSGVGFSVEELRSQYPNGMYFRIAVRATNDRTLTINDLAASGITLYTSSEDVPEQEIGWNQKEVMKVTVNQDGAVYSGKVFCFNGSGTCTVYSLDDKSSLGSFTLDNISALNPHANSVCFSNTFHAPGDQYPLLYVNVYNNYSSAADRMEGTCCVYRLTEDDGQFTTELVQVVRIGFTEDLSLWKSKENNGDVRPYGNFVVDTDKDELYAFVMRDAENSTRFFRFRLPDLDAGVYSATYGCNVVTLEIGDILSWFDTNYMTYMQGCCYGDGKILSVEGFSSGTLRIIDLETQREVRTEYLADRGLTCEPELICLDNGTLYYAGTDGTLRVLSLDGMHFHNYTAATTAPTCTEQGYTTHTCSTCSNSYVDSYVDALGHSEVVDSALIPTSSKSGLTEGKHCSTCGTIIVPQETLPAKGYEWMLEDGEFKILLIGNSFSEDASNAGMPNSQMLDILQAMLGNNVEVTVGLCYSGGKGLNWHATQSEQGNKSYSLRVISTETEGWKSYGSYSSADALTWTNWDVVSLQHYEINTTTGKESNAYPNQVDPKFDSLKPATEFMLDYVNQYAPQTDVYFYMHWARAYNPNLNESLATYNKMADYMPVVLDYAGNNSGNRFETIIPVGLSVQNARTTYLALLAYNTTAYADKNLNLTTDAQIGLQRDGGHLSFNIGRYIAGLTFAETILPMELRAEEYVLPDIRITESIGRLPKEYTTIAQKSVWAALESWKNGSLEVTEIEGYKQDPTVAAGELLANTLLNIDCHRDADAISKAVLKLLSADFAVDKVVQNDGTAEVTIRFGYTRFTVTVNYEVDEHSYNALVTAPTCTEQGYTTHTCQCGDTYVDTYVAPLGHNPGAAVVENRVEPTCTTSGSYDSVIYCVSCDIELSRTNIKAEGLGHKFENYVSNNDATCTANGTKTAKCERCDETDTKIDENSNIGHTPGKAVVENKIEPTCTKSGSYDNVTYCEVCNAELDREKITVSALGHTPGKIVVENKIEPTCTNPGSYDNVTYCEVCYTELERETIAIKAIGHNYGAWAQITAPGCETDGVERRNCSGCDKYETRNIPAHGHKWLEEEHHKICEFCGEMIEIEKDHFECEASLFETIINIIVNFFRSLFGLPEKCVCGEELY